jgi:hypothetical protein
MLKKLCLRHVFGTEVLKPHLAIRTPLEHFPEDLERNLRTTFEDILTSTTYIFSSFFQE